MTSVEKQCQRLLTDVASVLNVFKSDAVRTLDEAKQTIEENISEYLQCNSEKVRELYKTTWSLRHNSTARLNSCASKLMIVFVLIAAE